MGDEHANMGARYLRNDLDDAEELTNAAIERLRAYREEQKTLPEIHVHVDDTSKKNGRPLWLTVLVSLGVPAMLLEVIRRWLE